MELARHLLKAENEHLEIHEIRGFMADTVLGALKEAQALSLGTKCKQFLFSVSLSPPETESVPIDAFEDAISKIEEKTQLTGHPRVVIFHEKEGRRHCHVVWSRIDAETMTATPLPFFKLKLREVSKALYFEHGWKMPKGLMDSKARDLRNFDLAEWQQAKRIGQDPRQLKANVQECWAVSDTRTSFKQALEERGLYLARGDRRAHVVVAYEGEVFSLARLIDKRVKDVKAKLGDADDLGSVEETRAHIASVVAPKLKGLIAEARIKHARTIAPLQKERQAMVILHQHERKKLSQGQALRFDREKEERAKRLRGGVRGVWDRLTGQRDRQLALNDAEALQGLRRDRAQRQALIEPQLRERLSLQFRIREARQVQAIRLTSLHRELVALRQASAVTMGLAGAFERAAELSPTTRAASREQQPSTAPQPPPSPRAERSQRQSRRAPRQAPQLEP